jgi:hypothetical protein
MVILAVVVFIVSIPVIAILLPLVDHALLQLERSVRDIHVGDPIVYCIQKVSSHPGRRARAIDPAPCGETYSYLVDKFWTVETVLDDGRIVAVTRTRKHHCLSPADPHLRKAGWVERLRHWSRFPQLNPPASAIEGQRN